MMDGKINVIAKDGKVLVGNDFHVLNSETTKSFSTIDPYSFVKYCENINTEDQSIYYGTHNIILMPNEIGRNTKEAARCDLNDTDPLKDFCKKLNYLCTVDSFEEFLYSFKRYLKSDSLDLLANIRNLSVSKVTNIKRQTKQNGNFVFHVSRETGKESFEPPEKIGFKIPVFDFVDYNIDIETDLFFVFKEEQDGVSMFFRMRTFGFDEVLINAKKEIIEKIIEPLSFPKYFGMIKSESFTDAWKYQKNHLD